MNASSCTAGLYLLGIAGLAFAAAGGCDEVALNLGGPPNRPARPAGQPVVPGAGQAERPARPAAAADAPPAASGYQQVVLHSEPAPGEVPPGVRYVRLVRSAAGDAGPVLSWLYVPSGPAGSHHRYCLVYPTRIEADAAARAAMLLDVPAIAGVDETTIPAEPAEAFSYGVGLLYNLAPGLAPEAPRARRAEAALSRALASPHLGAATRWAAGIIAGTVASEYLYDYDAAERYFAAAEAHAEPGSLEQMCTWFARAGAYLQNGRPDQARQLLARILGQFSSLRDTEAFVRASRMLTDLERKR